MTAEKKVKAEEASAKKQNQFVEVMKRLSYNKGSYVWPCIICFSSTDCNFCTGAWHLMTMRKSI